MYNNTPNDLDGGATYVLPAPLGYYLDGVFNCTEQKCCPEDKPDCDDSEKVPCRVQNCDAAYYNKRIALIEEGALRTYRPNAQPAITATAPSVSTRPTSCAAVHAPPAAYALTPGLSTPCLCRPETILLPKAARYRSLARSAITAPATRRNQSAAPLARSATSRASTHPLATGLCPRVTIARKDRPRQSFARTARTATAPASPHRPSASTVRMAIGATPVRRSRAMSANTPLGFQTSEPPSTHADAVATRSHTRRLLSRPRRRRPTAFASKAITPSMVSRMGRVSCVHQERAARMLARRSSRCPRGLATGGRRRVQPTCCSVHQKRPVPVASCRTTTQSTRLTTTACANPAPT